MKISSLGGEKRFNDLQTFPLLPIILSIIIALILILELYIPIDVYNNTALGLIPSTTLLTRGITWSTEEESSQDSELESLSSMDSAEITREAMEKIWNGLRVLRGEEERSLIEGGACDFNDNETWVEMENMIEIITEEAAYGATGNGILGLRENWNRVIIEAYNWSNIKSVHMFDSIKGDTWMIFYDRIGVNNENNTISIVKTIDNVVNFSSSEVWLYQNGNTLNMLLENIMFIFN
uniref:hypothetical protein n=1 Tax=Conidiobolus taihushanensis TaxID=2721185 RepID=UPI001D121952|nr:hypothetical protein LK112_mgp19 [Conidiobolus taihushanensis]QZZ81392.1 hypothetical protein [Conidiobolus taihushanensis]